jgi:vesicle transport through interaction with t-SNAREs protein 1
MDLDTHNLPPTQKATLLAKLPEYKSDLNNLKLDFKKVSMAHDPVASRNELMESQVADHVMVCNIHFGTLCIFVQTLAIAHHT